MKVLFVNDSTSNPNWGDRAAAIALKKMIVESGATIAGIMTEAYLKRSLFYLASPDNGALESGLLQKVVKNAVPPICMRIGKKIASYFDSNKTKSANDLVPGTYEEFEDSFRCVRQAKNIYDGLARAMETCDVILIHGDGCMMGNTRIARAQLFLTHIAKKHFNKAVIIVNHTADFDHPELRKMAQMVYPLFDDVVYRDAISGQKCKTLCAGRVAADSAFLFQPMPQASWAPVARRWTYFDVWPDTATFDPSEPYICLGGSSIYFYNQAVDRLNLFRELIRHLQSIYAGQVVLTASDLRDQEIFRPMAAEFGLPLIGLSTPVQQAVDILGHAQTYIGGRWHAGIFALRGGTPIIPISSITFKMEALSRMAGLAPMAFDALKLEHDLKEIGKQLTTYLNQGSGLRTRLRDWAEAQSKECWQNVAYLQTRDTGKDA